MKEKDIDKYLGFHRELNKLWNMRVTVITILMSTSNTFHLPSKKIRKKE